MNEADMDFDEMFPQPKSKPIWSPEIDSAFEQVFGKLVRVPKPPVLTDKQKMDLKLSKLKARQKAKLEKLKLKVRKQKARAKKAKSPSVLKKQCDVLFSKVIRLRDGKCLKCGTTENLQCAHIASRKHLAGRWESDNALTLCYRCHIHWAHKEPIEFSEWVKENYYEMWTEAGSVTARLFKPNYELILDQLTERYQGLMNL